MAIGRLNHGEPRRRFMLPFSSSRDPNKADDNEFVLLEVGDFLKAK
jgi:hypothetical protein